MGRRPDKTRTSLDKAMLAILAAGILLRLIYVLFSTIYDRQYDISEMDLYAGYSGGGGHLGYIHYIYANGHLPDMDPASVYQFSHPPLHYLLSALWMRFASLFMKDLAALAESIQVIPFVCSLLTLYVLFRIICLFRLSEGARRFVMLLFAVHPSLILLSGSVNNDAGGLFFSLLCVYELICWSRDHDIRTVLKLALFFGLGLMTKQSVAEMTFPIAAVFVYVFVKSCIGAADMKKRTAVGLLKQFTLFLVIAFPIGMWFYLRNLLRFGTPLVTVHILGEDSWQYIGNVPLLNRLLWPVPTELLSNLRSLKIGCGYNLWIQIMRTSVLGEWDMAQEGSMVKALSMLLMLTGIVLAFIAFVSFFRVFVLGGKRYAVAPEDRIHFGTAYAAHFLLYLKFACDYPYQCSMHFRYINILLLFPAVALGYTFDRRQGAGRVELNVLLALFAVLSVAMTFVWCGSSQT